MNKLFSVTNVACAAGIFLVCGGCSRRSPDPSPSSEQAAVAPARVTAGKPVRKTLERHTLQPGRIEAFEEAPLYPKLAGYVQDVLVDIGDSVQKDQLLIKLSIPEMLDEVKQMEALVAQADADIVQSEAAVKAAEATAGTAEAKVAQANAGIGRAAGEYEQRKAEHARLAAL